MAPEILTGNQAGAHAKVYKQYIAGMTHTAFGYHAVAANVEDGDIFEMCKVPAGALVVGGSFSFTALDTDGTPELDMDVGWANNGASTETIAVSDGTTYTNGRGNATDADGLIDAGVLDGPAVLHFPMGAGPIYFANETMIQVEANVAAEAFSAGSIFVEVRYVLIG